MRGGRGAAGAGGPKLVSEEKECGEERERQDEADEGQCACGVHVCLFTLQHFGPE